MPAACHSARKVSLQCSESELQGDKKHRFTSAQMVDTSSVVKASDKAELTEDNILGAALVDPLESHTVPTLILLYSVASVLQNKSTIFVEKEQ